MVHVERVYSRKIKALLNTHLHWKALYGWPFALRQCDKWRRGAISKQQFIVSVCWRTTASLLAWSYLYFGFLIQFNLFMKASLVCTSYVAATFSSFVSGNNIRRLFSIFCLPLSWWMRATGERETECVIGAESTRIDVEQQSLLMAAFYRHNREE